MIPAAFEYTRPSTLDAALDLIAGADPSIRLLAGGQSLIPLMKLRLARPERLVDVGRIAELRGITGRPDGGLAIGALTTWTDLLEDERVRRYEVLADVISMIGDVQVRNRGTIGGSLAHADPSGDIAAAALALDVQLVARSAARGERAVAASELFVGPFATILEPDEILTEIHVPALAGGSGSAYSALPQQASGYPIAGVAAVVTRRAGAEAVELESCVIGVTGVGEQPYRAFEVERSVLAGTDIPEAVRAVADGQRVAADIHADREYRSAMAVVMARRALESAVARAG